MTDSRDFLFMSSLFGEMPHQAGGFTQVTPAIAVNTVAPVISGTEAVGQTLSCTTGTWAYEPTAYIYQWRRDGAAIPSATSNTYLVDDDDGGHFITCAVVAVNPYGLSTAAVSNTLTIPIADVPVNTVAPVISGTTEIGETLSCTTGTWDNDPDSYTYLWRRNGISVVSGSTYLLTAPDSEASITCEVTATNENGDSAPAVSNTLVIGEVLVTPNPLENVVCVSAADDTEPDFEFDLPANAAAGMILAAEYSVADAGSWTTYFDHILTEDDILSDIFTVYGVTPLTEGLWDFRFRLENSSEFSTWATLEDVPINSAPSISSFLPVDGATDVAVDTEIVITFDRDVQYGSGSLFIYDAFDDSVIEEFDATDLGTGLGEVEFSGDTITIRPGTDFDNDLDCYVQIDATYVENEDGIPFAGIADETTYNLSTEAAPVVTEFELKVDTFYSSGTWTSPADIRANIAKKVELWAAGGAAVTATGSGGGGAYSAGVDVAVTPSTGYAVVVGVGAAAANGTNSTFNSTTVVAEGGKSIGNGSSGGLAANGTGTTKYSGGNGAAGSGNVTCGTAAGSEGAGNNISIVGGYPDGAWGTATATNAAAWGGGARSSAALGGAGGKGHCRISYEVPRTAGFPYCVGRRAGRTPTASALTSHTATYPVIEGGILAGDLIFLIIHNASSTITLSSSGYASLDVETNSTNLKVEVFTKTAAGGETGTFTISSSSSSGLVWLMLVYRNAGTPVSVSNNGSSISPTFLVNNMGSTGDRLWLAVMGTDPAGVNQNPPTAASSGFNNIYIEPGHIQACELRDTVSSKTPGTHTLSLSEQWCTFNIAIPFA